MKTVTRYLTFLIFCGICFSSCKKNSPSISYTYTEEEILIKADSIRLLRFINAYNYHYKGSISMNRALQQFANPCLNIDIFNDCISNRILNHIINEVDLTKKETKILNENKETVRDVFSVLNLSDGLTREEKTIVIKGIIDVK